ncbi:hydroxyethylthiazole kinase [Alicyclobacillus contaminans]|uniref:hydroxyethylthiazole kinase n=1 Tax=Alicyclobacillus contaminans TaxID=392016 RepID=UPI000423A33F|nr:hydroxyethylthiazole kinase [Alicyclobacillus contaminans]GMA50659.1 hydroxyethylthiazole kinase [Alicyclobacillus contaminans]
MNLGYWLEQVREQRPLVHNITNIVVTNIAANVLLSAGASPVMADAPEEVADMARIASALALNMGTISSAILDVMVKAGQSANAHQVPIVFDPVGIGATPFRSEAAQRLGDAMHFTVLRGNAGEVGVFLGCGGEVRGVDSAGASAALPAAMKAYAKAHRTVVVATGAEDLVTDGETVWRLANGHPLLASITGSGCMLTALLGGFVGVVPRGSDVSTYAEAAMAAVTCLNVAGEHAAVDAAGPGTFQARLFDALYHLTSDEVNRQANISVMEGI